MSRGKDIASNIEGCQFCFDDLFQVLNCNACEYPKQGIVQVWEIFKQQGMPIQTWKELVSDFECPECGHSLGLEHYLISDIYSFGEATANLVSTSLNEEIAECQRCNVDKIVFEQKHGDPANLNVVNELLNENGVTEDLEDLYIYIASRIKCKCGNQLNLDDPYVTKEEVEDWYSDEPAEVIIKTFGISAYKAQNFVEFLLKYPMHALNHEVGQKIYKIIKDRNIPGLVDLRLGQQLYRGRKRDLIERHVPFVPSELWAPPLGTPGHGRFNPIGVQVLYLSDTPKTCACEIGLSNVSEETAEIGEFILLKNIKLWDTRDLDIRDFILMNSMNRRFISREYLLPNFLAQCCTLAGINGIIYGSIKNPGGWNIALLNYKENESIALVDVIQGYKLEEVKQAQQEMLPDELGEEFSF